MFSTPKKALSKFRASPYFSPLRLFGFCGGSTERASSFRRIIPSEPSYRPLPRPNPRKKCYPPGDPRRRPSQRLCAKPLRQQRSVRARSYHNLSKAGPCNAAQPNAQPNPQPPVVLAPAFDFDAIAQKVRRVAVHAAPHLTPEDKIFMTQLEKLNINHNMAEVLNGLETQRASAERAQRMAPVLEAERKARNAPYQDMRKVEDKFIIDYYNDRAKEKQDKEAVLARMAQAQKDMLEMEARINAERAESIRIQYEALFAECERDRQEREKRRAQERRRWAKEREANIQLAEENHRRVLAAQKARRERAEAEAARLLAERQAAEAQARAEEEARKKAELEAQRAREELERQAHEARIREEEANRRAALEVQAREEEARRYAEEMARMQQQVEAHQAREPRLWRDVSMQDVWSGSGPSASDVSMAEEVPAPTPTPPPAQPTDADRWNLYEWKWDALKGDVGGLLVFSQLPWPVLHDVYTIHDLTPERFSEFLFNPQRPGYEPKTKKERVKNELLRFHPDKYDGKILGKVHVEEHALVKEAVGRVTRFLTTARS
ncbi:uncharacterized protein LACBIDRAFT_294592 [Laccaria bicolor S238N-H82]|uniref:Predicted protein n=1 Tax=Laccaria bicolor (strain S238N-H82 / ATCC MYA-4686) TaxID=486041 RepID=B0DEY5_LACBS|nr:uncharacterized protein LACBIDRAFT_294592 [Laccaria bicolor S238N-H82]EDR06753.1 predicted protein [Laccaria bicolor S238N-H82]|eukprot:XP_001882600.1 predicted protein [Laccaria bicolor S238N-H82]